jgi:hypothetical protein
MVMVAAGGTLGDVVQITVRLKDYRDNAPLLNPEWYRTFPDPADQPTRPYSLPPNSRFLFSSRSLAGRKPADAT